MYSIVTKDLSVGYKDKMILKSVNINIPRGKITVIVGPNGCGKSTLVKSLGRLIRPKSGEIFLGNDSLYKLSTLDIARRLAILPQSPSAPAGLTVGELVEYGRYPHSNRRLSDKDHEIITWALDATKLSELSLKELDTLSGGQRQRAWIAMALAQKTDTILLDEPTTYLDIKYQLEVLELLSRLNKEKGYTIVIVLHDLNLAARYADYMIAMKDGVVIKHGNPSVIMESAVIKETFAISAEFTTDKKRNKPICLSYELIDF